MVVAEIIILNAQQLFPTALQLLRGNSEWNQFLAEDAIDWHLATESKCVPK